MKVNALDSLTASIKLALYVKRAVSCFVLRTWKLEGTHCATKARTLAPSARLVKTIAEAGGVNSANCREVAYFDVELHFGILGSASCGFVGGGKVSASTWKGGVEDPLMVGLRVREAKYRRR